MELDRTILKKLWNGEKVSCPKCKEVFRTITIFNKMLKGTKMVLFFVFIYAGDVSN